MWNHRFRNTVSYVTIGLLAASTLAFAQNSLPPQTPDNSNQQAANPNGGWKRVGDSGNTDPNTAPNNPVYAGGQQPVDNGSYANPQNPPQQQTNQSAPTYSQQQPMYQGQYPPPQQQPGPYPQQPGPYPQQPGPYAQQAPYGQYPSYGQPNAYPSQGQPNYPAPPPIPATLTIAQGTYVTVRVNQLLSSDRNQPGDAFSATLVDPLVVNGIVVAEPGQTVGGRVALVDKHGPGHPARLGIQITTLTLVDGQQVPIATQLTSRKGGTTPGGVEAGSIIATTGLGAAIGAAADWGRGAAIGAGAGALAGIIGAVVTHNHASVVTPESVLTFQLEAPVSVNTTASQVAFRYVERGEYSQQPYARMSGPAPGPYVAGAPAPYPYAYPYPYYAWGYPYYWGPSFAFYYGRGYYPYRYYGRGYVRGGVVVRH